MNPEHLTPQGLLAHLYAMVVRQAESDAASLVHDVADVWLRDGDRAACNELLERADLARLSRRVAIALLGATLDLRRTMPCRKAFCDRYRVRFASEAEAHRIDLDLAKLG